MASLAKDGKYTVTPEMKEELSDFYGNYTSEKETAEVIKKLYEDTGYIIDTHTAVAAGVYDKYKEATGDTATCLLYTSMHLRSTITLERAASSSTQRSLPEW